ncbi:hypothetical protein [Kitasatospora viridis]|uniref:Uncharacterized protein n=1 Tax=Kitasatospora viridis TaxID=281105 RepID=A0A561SFL8_9ACTN|nr:hypothetical protein [Kitasatospora viridis]TWF73660.1 hypothetical protein FHX73_15276 [Kitasatospora viridis]
MLTLNRVLGTSLAAGALLLVGLAPAASAQAAPGTTGDYYATGWAFYSQTAALNNATNAVYNYANTQGFPSTECTTTSQQLWPTVAVGQPVRWNAKVQIHCAAPSA